VLSVDKDQALCLNPANGEQRQMPTDDLVVVCRFGEPIFPALTPVDQVQNGPDDAPWHTLIEADNYHALQLLEYLYTGQVDCIYIDPPYNTGARDWKYNNDYVDANDRYRHSKWLAMMKRRLVLAKKLLKYDGALICAIDDNEISRLWMLIESIFPDRKIYAVTIQHNPGGTQGDQFSVMHEYALFVLTRTVDIYPREHLGGDTYNLRRWGSTSTRFEGRNCFYPIYVKGNRIIQIGSVPDDDYTPKSQTIPVENEMLEIWPIDKPGVERKWRYARDTIQGILHRAFVVSAGDRTEILLRREEEPQKTVWIGKKYNAEQYGTKMITSLIQGDFSYPKSIYTIFDCLYAVLAGKKAALTVDFFAGSGTTLNALNLLNAADGGNRRCILVTNNEVSEDEAKSLTKQGYRPDDAEWERHGICRSVTWPRSKYTILGRRDDGTDLEGDYLTGNTVSKEKARTFRRLGFIDPGALGTATRKKEIVSLIEGIPMSHIDLDMAFFVSEDKRHTAAILFDDTQGDAFLDALEEMDHITHFYIVTRSNKMFQDLKAQITDLLGPIEAQEEEKRPMREGFPANLEYFKLDFLEKDQVALGQQFRAILPLLWLRAGAVGPMPELTEDDSIPAMLLPPKNPFAVLVDETRFADFQAALAARDDLTHVFLITDSEEAFQEMAAQLTAPHVIQLYRDYLENFAINRGGVS
jgi:adenine-specific DNA-methyltransferase